MGSVYLPPRPPFLIQCLVLQVKRKVTLKGKKSQQGLRSHLGIDLGTSLTSGGTPLYKQYTVCAAPKGRGFAPFWSENLYRLCPFWSGIGYGFLGNDRNV